MNPSSQAFFEQKYRESSDPWDFASNSYELARYGAIERAITGRRYVCAFEPACSIGILTAVLAKHCDHVDATDISPTAASRAQEFCAALPNASVRCSSLADDIPPSFDLLILSEVGYYFSLPDLRAVLTRCVASLSENGVLVASHWLGTSIDHVLNGDTVHEELARIPSLQIEHSERHLSFRLDRWRKTPEVCG